MDGIKFKFPHRFKLENMEEYLKDRRCLVVSFFGKTTYAQRSNKGVHIDAFTGGSHFLLDEEGISSSKEPEIEAVFDSDRDVMFLHMRGLMDAFTLAQKCKEAEEQLQQKGFLSFWSNRRYEHAKALIFLFQVSHILVCCQPGHTFDVSYVHLFKSLDNMRNKLQTAVGKLLKEVPSLPKDWIAHGRLCPPRVLFFFQSAPISLRGNRGVRDERREAKGHKHSPIQRLEFSLEDQIYRILRKARIITNIASNSLFAVPSNQGFVFVETGERGLAMDPGTSLLNSFYSLLNNELPEEFSYSGPFYHQHLTEELRPRRSFATFLAGHINLAMEKGFFDNVSKHGPALGYMHWEVPLLSEWLQVSDLLFTFYTVTLTSAEGHDYAHIMCELRDDMETETMFSELRCKKILPQALQAYQEGLPPHYTADYHQARLLAALSLYSMQARGPASEKYAERLAADCTDYWQSGRMRCEELSLTGNNCIHRRHILPGQDERHVDRALGKKILPAMQHTSGVQYIAACNCGRRQANREDPFTLKEANFTFYQELEEECCKDLEHVEFPTHQPIKLPATSSQVRLHDLDEGSQSHVEPMETQQKGTEAVGTVEDGEAIITMEATTCTVTALVDGAMAVDTAAIGQARNVQIIGDQQGATDSPSEGHQVQGSESSAVEQARATNTSDDDRVRATETPTIDHARSTDTPTGQDEAEIILEVLENLHIDSGKSTNKVETLLSRTTSHTECLAAMKTLSSPPGLKPEFSSWSLVLIGNSHVYSHSAGLGTQHGFMSSSKFLLPWEVPLTKASHETLAAKWVNVLESVAKRASLRSPEEAVSEQITVKVFVGFEYECPRGHRFMISAPDKPMKSSSTMREAANRLVCSDLPLYMACPCRLTKPPVAQLMRIHIVTPKAPVYVTLLPQVQPSAGGPVFVSGWDAPHRLSLNSYWVLRLPYVYWGEGGAHLPPLVPPTLDTPAGFLLKGCVGIDEDYVDS